MPTNYTQLQPNDPNYVNPAFAASLPAKLRNAFTGNYTPGSEGIRGAFQSAFSPVAKIGNQLTSRITGLQMRYPQQSQAVTKLGFATALGFLGPALYGAYGAGAGGAAGAGGVGTGASASTVNPFAANAGLGTNWASIGGTAAFPTVAGAGGIGAGTAAGAGGAGSVASFPAAAANTPWYNTYLGQTGINTGLNLLGGYLNNRAIGNAQQQSQQQIEDRIRQALAALSPEQIMALAQQFLPQLAAQMSGAGQTAVQAVREQAARTGQLESPRALSFEAGTRAKLASDVQQRAFEAAFNTAGAQAGAITGAPYTPIQPQTGYADAIANSVNQAYLARALSQQQSQGTPYRWPGQQWMGGY